MDSECYWSRPRTSQTMYSWEWSMLNLCRDQLPALRTSIVSEFLLKTVDSNLYRIEVRNLTFLEEIVREGDICRMMHFW